ncbi:MAG: uncharacterized protein PWQ57_282 [Desulfovibrionales bacterium]|jgi:predicted nucleotidyltransferase|nr:uncharacterized protein [Desulfovibrionales bacterium]
MPETVAAHSKPLALKQVAAIAGPILRKYGVKSAAVFGSVARGENESDSDIDLLVEYPEDMTAFTALDLKAELEARLGRKVDLTPPRYLKRHVRPSVLADQIKIF